MSDDDSARFQIGLDEEDHTPPLKDEIDPPTANESSRRLPIITILVPCLFLVLLLFVYVDLKKSISAIQNTGQTEVQNLSSDFESRLSSLSIQVAKLKDLLATDTAGSKKEIASLSKKISRETSALKKAAAKYADKKTVKKADTALEKRFSPLKKDLESLSANIHDINAKVSRELAVFSQKFSVLNRELATLKSQTDDLSATYLDREALKDALLEESTRHKKDIETISIDLKKQLKAIQQEIKRITTRTAHSQNASTDRSGKQTAASKQSNTSPPQKKPHNEVSQNVSNDIIEQELIE